jgi:hypothetical protein
MKTGVVLCDVPHLENWSINMTSKKKTTSTTDQPTPKRNRTAKAPAQPEKVIIKSIDDAAALVLAEEGRPMTIKEMIEAVAAKDYWSTVRTRLGRTPDIMLEYNVRSEISTGGDNSRFRLVREATFARTDAR